MLLVGLTGGIGSGKSTVSAMLAERGAVIVDADADRPRPAGAGSPLLAAMAERFGSSIIPPTARSIAPRWRRSCSDDQQAALADLNAIVHPAMQVEIAPADRRQAGTDRVVVLDFPLLAENPRDGLAATIVVDVDPEIAVQRLVEQRGMDDADARDRIEQPDRPRRPPAPRRRT